MSEDEAKKELLKPMSAKDKVKSFINGVQVVPYFKVRDFNAQGEDQSHFECNPEHNGYEVGLKFTF